MISYKKVIGLLTILLTLLIGCDSASPVEEPSKLEKRVAGPPWHLVDYEVVDGTPGDGFGVAEKFEFSSDGTVTSVVGDGTHKANWTVDDEERTIIIFHENPSSDDNIIMVVLSITNDNIHLIWNHFGYDVVAEYSRTQK